ncbi:MAG: RmuC-domain protein [Candidatus Gottesmanbacteria bacterium GW2011_GWC2_39_8]|uniref:RmuC-domain protein n=1 Tax=Candidatus Gottesmanbacteria bacterium GW2011_GWC2_39_8 TaxID=1618450 RepID=A0A0G0PY18_9BACT|nr:MAG: RmuC-domain protein [Candidatus Gottesmanbacteria bacterium GW2011_GWC2_39_8]
MNWILILVALVAGFVLGLACAFALRLVQAKTARELADEVFRESEAQRKASIDAVVDNVKASFGSLSLDALAKSTEEFLKLAKEKLESEREVSVRELDGKKSLIDQQLQRMTTELENVSKLMKELETDRVQKFGELTSHLKNATEQTTALMQTTNTLREALSSTKARGQWGERMAEDVLRLGGFIENINYLKQKTIENAGSRPDFTFLLPHDLKLNMDVKFPLDNYIRFLEAKGEADKTKFRNDFLKDVKARIKEVTNREYINPEQNSVDYVLLFIPNEQIYAFIHEQDSSIFDEGIKNKVVFCSPVTLFAILAVVRQAVDNFALEKTSNEILSLFGAFKKQWGEFLKKLELVGKRIDDAQKEYDSLTTTRQRQLEKPLNKIDSLRVQRGLPIAPDEEGESFFAEEKVNGEGEGNKE